MTHATITQTVRGNVRFSREKKLCRLDDARYRFTVLMRNCVIAMSASPTIPVRLTMFTGSALSEPASSSKVMPNVEHRRIPIRPFTRNVSR